jgi:D-alanyl-D-alanine dipeptidase
LRNTGRLFLFYTVFGEALRPVYTFSTGFAACPLTFILAALAGCAETPQYEQGPPVVRDLAIYRELVRRDPSKRLIDLRDAIPGIITDIRYATGENFMKQPVYSIARPLLRAPAAAALHAVQRELAKQGLGIKIWDAYRPYRVTQKMWDLIRDPDFVADPAQGSRHNRGAAVDLTLVDLATGRELELPTGYDEFSARAHHDFPELGGQAIRHRALLREIMERHGFERFPTEWWHYDFRGWERFELMDLSLEEVP